MRLNTIDSVDVSGKRVLLRVDFNVSTFCGKITDDFRIMKSLPTIKYLIEKEAKVIIISHFGRPSTDSQLERSKFGMRSITERLEKDLGYPVRFIPECIGAEVEKTVFNMKTGEILMLENLRFHKGEEENDSVFASQLAKLADIYVNDAFSVSHRAHASMSAITSFLPSYAGFLLAEEVKVLHDAYENPKKPLVIIMGGGKIETKLKLIKRFFDKADDILLGGVIANFILHIKGIAIGRSNIGNDDLNEAKDLNWTSPKLHLPVDVVVAREISDQVPIKTVGVGKVGDEEIILDIGRDTIELFSKIIDSASTIIWNGPLGFSELDKFANGTREFAKAVVASKAHKIIGGGDSIVIIDKLGLSDKIDFVSTGGGAMLEFLAGEPMPGINALVQSPKSKVQSPKLRCRFATFWKSFCEAEYKDF